MRIIIILFIEVVTSDDALYLHSRSLVFLKKKEEKLLLQQQRNLFVSFAYIYSVIYSYSKRDQQSIT